MCWDFRLSGKEKELKWKKKKKKISGGFVLLPFLPLLSGALEDSDKEERINCVERKVQRSAKKKLKTSGENLWVTARFKDILFVCFPNVIGDDKIDN